MNLFFYAADSKQEDDVLRQLLNDGKDTLSSTKRSLNSVTNFPRSSSSASTSTAQEETIENGGKELTKSGSVREPGDILTEMGSVSPEKLRQQAMEEKSKYKILKADGKSGEALKAFKRGKELEREAAGLELSLRKNRKKAMSSTSMVKDDCGVADTEIQPTPKSRKGKEDISAELKELGWSDMELNGADKRSGTMTLEGELSTLIGETLQNGKTNKSSRAIDMSEVTALRKRAVALKREGNMAEAKEELKKAKILEQKLKEQELLAEADESDESDDEFASLIKSMGADKQDDLLMTDIQMPSLDIDQLMRMADDVGEDSHVTEADLDDPEIAAALMSFGWSEEASPPEKSEPRSKQMDRESLLQQIQSLKREAVNNKRAGNMTEAMALLKKSKLLQGQLDSMEDETSEVLLKPQNRSNAEESDLQTTEQSKPPLKSKIMIQRELLAVKRKALSLKREGKIDEAEEELKKAKIIELQLEEIGSNSKEKASQVISATKEPDLSSIMDVDGEGEDEDVTENDLQDPTYLSLLNNLGWKDDAAESNSTSSEPPLQIGSSSRPMSESVKKPEAQPRRSKAELQRELLGLKRKALTLRRQGQHDEAEEVMNSAKSIEERLAEMEMPKKQTQAEVDAPKESGFNSKDGVHETVIDKEAITKTTDMPTESSMKIEVEPIVQPSAASSMVTSSTVNSSTPQKEKAISNAASPPLSSRDRFKLQQRSLAHKRQALKLRREGRAEEADAELQLAKEIELQLEDSAPQSSSGSSTANMDGIEALLDPQLMSALKSIGITDTNPPPTSQTSPELQKPDTPTQPSSSNYSSIDERTQLVQQIKAEKIKAVNLKREGKQTEALNTLRHAKMLEKKLNSLLS